MIKSRNAIIVIVQNLNKYSNSANFQIIKKVLFNIMVKIIIEI